MEDSERKIEPVPPHILDSSVKERIVYFQGYTFAHPKLQQAYKELIDAIREPSGASLIFVIGPTGIGKTTLINQTCQKVIDGAIKELIQDKGRIPIFGIEAPAPELRNFDWKDFYLRALCALGDPFYRPSTTYRYTKAQLRFQLEKALMHRKPQAFYIDEAQNLGRVSSGKKLLDQTDCIKSLANISQLQCVLIGTYELMDLRDLNGQLCRRSRDIHFSRYRAENSEDFRKFRDIVKNFELQLPLRGNSNLSEHLSYLYERSLGCVGILKDWFTRSLAASLEQDENSKTLTLQRLKAHAIPARQCNIILQECIKQEKILANDNSEGESKLLREMLKLDSIKNKKTTSSSKKNIQRVGQPNPVRRPINPST